MSTVPPLQYSQGAVLAALYELHVGAYQGAELHVAFFDGREEMNGLYAFDVVFWGQDLDEAQLEASLLGTPVALAMLLPEWWRTCRPVTGSAQGREAGKTYCQARLDAACGILARRACGRSTSPRPAASSARWRPATTSSWARRPSRPRREERGAVVVPFAATDRDHVAVEVDVLHPQGEALEQAEAAAVKDLGDEPEARLQLLEERRHLAPREHRGKVLGTAGALEAVQLGHGKVEDTAIEEEDGAEGLVLRGRRRVPLHREVVEEGGDLGAAELPGVPAVVEEDEGADPLEVCLLGARGIMKAAEGGLHGCGEGHRGVGGVGLM